MQPRSRVSRAVSGRALAKHYRLMRGFGVREIRPHPGLREATIRASALRLLGTSACAERLPRLTTMDRSLGVVFLVVCCLQAILVSAKVSKPPSHVWDQMPDYP